MAIRDGLPPGAAESRRGGIKGTKSRRHARPDDTVPLFWKGEVPEPIKNRDPTVKYKRNRIPGEMLKGGGVGTMTKETAAVARL